MPYVEPTSRATGYLVTAANWNQDVVDNVSFLANPPACRVYHNTTQSIAHGVFQAVVFNSERFDTDSMHSTASNTSRITINTAGLYLVTGHTEFVTATDYTEHLVGFKVNGSTFIAFVRDKDPGTASDTRLYSVATTWKFAATDYVELFVFQGNGAAAARNLSGTAAYGTEFSATWIGRG